MLFVTVIIKILFITVICGRTTENNSIAIDEIILNKYISEKILVQWAEQPIFYVGRNFNDKRFNESCFSQKRKVAVLKPLNMQN